MDCITDIKSSVAYWKERYRAESLERSRLLQQADRCFIMIREAEMMLQMLESEESKAVR